MSYTPAITMGVWLGNPDTTILKKGTSSIGSPIVAKVMEFAHKEVYAPEGKWKSGDWFTQPAGIQRIGNEAYPSWWNKTQGQTNAKLTFNRVSKKKATECTPAGARIEFDVIKVTDPVTKKDSYSMVPDGYDAKTDDDCQSGVAPSVSSVTVPTSPGGDGSYTITVAISEGSAPVSTVAISVGGVSLTVIKSGNNYTAKYTGSSSPAGNGSVTVTDTNYRTGTKSF